MTIIWRWEKYRINQIKYKLIMKNKPVNHEKDKYKQKVKIQRNEGRVEYGEDCSLWWCLLTYTGQGCVHITSSNRASPSVTLGSSLLIISQSSFARLSNIISFSLEIMYHQFSLFYWAIPHTYSIIHVLTSYLLEHDALLRSATLRSRCEHLSVCTPKTM